MKGLVKFLGSLCFLLLGLPAFSQKATTDTFHFEKNVREQDFLPDQVIIKFKSSATISNARLATVTDHSVFRGVNVRNLHQPFANRSFVRGKEQNNQRGRKPIDLQSIYRIQLKKSAGANQKQALEKVINQLRKNADVEYVEPVYQYEPLSVYMSNDPQVSSQYFLKIIRAYDAWQLERGDPNVIIGLSDYGFATDHEDLKDNVFYNEADPVNGRDDDGDGYVDNYAGWNMGDQNNDVSGIAHGTNVAGLAAASVDNRKGIAGIGFGCRFLPVKIQGKSRFAGFESIVYLADRGCKVINLSWGRRGGPSAYEEDIIDYAAVQKDVVIVASAGNDGNDRYFYPASYQNVLSVAATDANDQKWSGSNYNDRVDIAAPGADMFSTAPGGYASIGSGTSFAAPLVTGAAALIRSQQPQLSASEVRELLMKTADNINTSNPSYAGGLGAGRLNLYRALTEGSPRKIDLVDQGLENNSVWVKVKSNSGNVENVWATLSTSSSLVQIVKDTIYLSTVGERAIKENKANGFRMLISPAAPRDTLISFQITFTANNLHEKQYFQLNVNPSRQWLRNDRITLALSNDGSIGFADESTSSASLSQVNFQYRDQNLLAGAGLLLGISPQQVSNNVPDHAKNDQLDNLWRTAFSPLQALRPVKSEQKDMALAGSFSDTLNNPAKIGLEVECSSYTWMEGKYAILEYRIKNVSGGTIDRLQAGIYADWDIGGAANNQTGWDAERRLGYVYNRQKNGLYAGVQLLTNHVVNYEGLDNTTYAPVQVFDGFTMAEKYQTISNGVVYPRTASVATDVAHVLAASLENLQEGESRVVAFALLAGDNLPDLQSNAVAAQNKFRALKQGPVPQIDLVTPCQNTPFVIQPANGTHFRLYNQASLSRPMAEGRMFQLTTTHTDSTYYVVNADSLFDSEPAVVHIQPYRANIHVVQSTEKGNSLPTVTVSDSSQATVWRLWDFGDGTIIRDSAFVTHTYAVEGEYTLQVTTMNTFGCEDTFAQLISVQPDRTLPPAVSLQPVRVYPNPAQGIVHIALPAEERLAEVKLVNSLGQERALDLMKSDGTSQYTANIADQSPGLYQIRIRIKGQWSSYKLLIH